MVREYVEIAECSSIEGLIATLEAVKEQIPAGCSEAQVRLRGDDVFGRHILITYSRRETPEELAVERRAQEFVTSWSAVPFSRFG